MKGLSGARRPRSGDRRKSTAHRRRCRTIGVTLIIDMLSIMLEVGLFLHFPVQLSCRRGPSRSAQDTSRRCREVGLFLHFSLLLPRDFGFAGESGWRNGRSLSWRPLCHSGGGDWPSAGASRGSPSLTKPLILLDDLASFGQIRDQTRLLEWVCICTFLFSYPGAEVLREALRTLLGAAQKWVCFCTVLLYSLASSASRGSPDGAMVALCPRDHCAIREGVTGRVPRPLEARPL